MSKNWMSWEFVLFHFSAQAHYWQILSMARSGIWNQGICSREGQGKFQGLDAVMRRQSWQFLLCEQSSPLLLGTWLLGVHCTEVEKPDFLFSGLTSLTALRKAASLLGTQTSGTFPVTSKDKVLHHRLIRPDRKEGVWLVSQRTACGPSCSH